MRINIGDKSLLKKTPLPIDVDGDPYILHKINEMPILFSAICPHQHNIVSEFHDTIWKCPSHDWTFEPNTGRSINAPQECLTKFPVEEINESLFVTFPDKIKTKIKQIPGLKIPPKISVVGNAALLVEWNSLNLLFDPWIEGPATFGSWSIYPPSNTTVDDLPKIDVIMISHEHSDHLHEFTLSKFDKDILILVPDVDNNRLSLRLKKMGFNNIVSLHSGISHPINEMVKITSFNSGSVWSDNIFYLQLGNFSILNVNDAGFNWGLKNSIGSVDLLCIQFSPASGFPATWNHLDAKSKLDIMNSRNKGMLRMIKQITDLMEPSFILPFANFNSLYLPEHQKYLKSQPKNTPRDVVELFNNDNVTVLELLPGETWDGKNNKFKLKENREKFYDENFLINYTSDQKIYDANSKFIPKEFTIEFEHIKNYFEGFSNSEITQNIGNYILRLIAEENQNKIDCLIEFNDGKVICHHFENNKKFHMSMSCPGGILQKIIEHDLSWDEMQSGYWAVYDRNPDTYNIALWQLFHAPWQARPNYINTNKNNSNIFLDKKSAIADIIEHGNKKTIQVLEKFGLYCAGCEASLGETLEDGCSIHGLTNSETNELLKELKYLHKNE